MTERGKRRIEGNEDVGEEQESECEGRGKKGGETNMRERCRRITGERKRKR